MTLVFNKPYKILEAQLQRDWCHERFALTASEVTHRNVLSIFNTMNVDQNHIEVSIEEVKKSKKELGKLLIFNLITILPRLIIFTVIILSVMNVF